MTTRTFVRLLYPCLLLATLLTVACRRDELFPSSIAPYIELTFPSQTTVQTTSSTSLTIFIQTAQAISSVAVQRGNRIDTALFSGNSIWTVSNYPLENGLNSLTLRVAGDGGTIYTQPATLLKLSLFSTSLGTMVLKTPRYNHTAVLLQNGKIFIAGGISTTGGAALRATELYDPATNISTSLPAQMLSPRAGHTATLLSDGKVLILGGETADNGSSELALPDAEIYDPAAGSFSQATFDRTLTRTEHAALLIAPTKFLITGGENDDEILFDAKTFSLTAQPYPIDGSNTFLLDANTYRHTLTLTNNKPVLLGYAFASDGTAYPRNSVLTPDNPAFQSGMTKPRNNHAAAELEPGLIVVTGGSSFGAQGAETVLQSIEIFAEPSLTFFTILPLLTAPRTGHTATKLSNGTVIILGGKNAGGVLSSAEQLIY
ncbi:MAG: hypothetical protein IAF08_15175 [Rhizobacter sp.]|nr:hypothetical protein [Chlorobiales bacterium]